MIRRVWSDFKSFLLDLMFFYSFFFLSNAAFDVKYETIGVAILSYVLAGVFYMLIMIITARWVN